MSHTIDLPMSVVGGGQQQQQQQPQRQGYTLSWQNLSYTVRANKNRFLRLPSTAYDKSVLNNVCGLALPGTVTAVMGPSGSGKSSLLEILSNRADGKVSGEILVNGGELTKRYKRISALVTQDDALQTSLTVRENLTYSALLRLEQSMTYQEKQRRIEEIIELLGLKTCQNTAIGTPFVRGISGGERRRTSIGVELINKPSILFLDEPTSGLDSLSATKIVELLKNLAVKYNMTIVFTIHQPSSYIYNMFDSLILLSRGQVVYSGPREDTVSFFEHGGHKLPPNTNPADFFIDIINFDFDELEKQKATENLIQLYSQSQVKSSLAAEVEKVKTRGNSGGDASDQARAYPTDFWFQTWVLLRRTTVVWAKNPLSYWTRVAMYTMMALMLGTCYWNISNSQTAIQDRVSALFFSVGFLCFMSIAAFPAFIEDRLLFVRERANGVYRVGPFALAVTIIQIPFVVLITITFTAIGYYMVNFHNGAEQFFYFFLNLFAALYVADSVVVCVSAVIPWYLIGIAVAAGMYGMWMLLSGFLIKKNNIPDGWIWMHYLSFQKYAFEGIIVNEFTGLSFPCDKITVSGVEQCACFYPDLNANCIVEGDEILKVFDYQDVNKWWWLLVVFSFAIGFRFVFYLLLRFLNKKSR